MPAGRYLWESNNSITPEEREIVKLLKYRKDESKELSGGGKI